MTEQQTGPPPAPPEQRRKPTAEPKKPRRSASWVPDPRWAHPLIFALWTYTISFLPWFGVPIPAVSILGAGCGVVAALRVRTAFPRVDYGDELPTRMTVLALAGGGASAAWIWRAGSTSPPAALGWLAAGSLLLALAYAVLRTGAPKFARKFTEQETARREEQARETWDRILGDVGLRLRVVELAETRAGFAVGVGPSGEKPTPLSELRAKIPEITARASMLLGREGVTVRDGDISVEGTEASHVHLIHVRTARVLEETIPFEPLGHPGSAADPVDIALYEDGQEMRLHLVGEPRGAQHVFVIGAQGSGKSTTASAAIGRHAECVDVIQGVIASDKLLPLAWPWIRPWVAGRCGRPGLDFVAGQDPQHAVEMLAGLLRLVRDRNSRLPDSGVHEVTADEPAIVVWIEESADLLGRPNRALVDGVSMTASMIVDALTRSSRSAQVAIVMMNQFALFETLGGRGSEIFRNVTVRIVLRTMSAYDGSTMLVGLQGQGADSTKLRHQSMLVQPSTEEPRVMPAKALHLTPEAVDALAVAVAGHRPELSEHEASVIGPAWTDRWAADRCPELVRKAEAEGLRWPGEGDEMGRDPMDRELRAMIEQAQRDGFSSTTGPDISRHANSGPAGDPGDLPSAEQGIADIEAATAGVGRPALPEPLDAVMRLLEEPGAPTDFVSTRQLAVLLGRVARDAEEGTLDEAAKKLGDELAGVDGELRTAQRRLKDGRARGYYVKTLRQVAARLARGGR